MQTNKMLIGGIVGGLTFFLLGWLVYGVLVMDFMMSNSGSATGVTKMPMDMWALFLGNISFGFLLTYIIGMHGTMVKPVTGAKIGATVGFLAVTGFDLIMYGTSNLMNLTGTFADIIVFTILSTITAAVIAAVTRRGGKKEA